MKIIVEVPHNCTDSGGIKRMIQLAIELPFYSKSVGGVVESLKFAQQIDAFVRFQKIMDGYPQTNSAWTVGLPDNTFPECDVCITYSDTPYINQLLDLPQVGRVLVYMLSWGMSPKHEMRNAFNPKVTTLCSTKKIEKAITAYGKKVYRIGFALDGSGMFNEKNSRKRYLAIYYSDMSIKKYDIALNIADELFAKGDIDGVISFGSGIGYHRHRKPKGLVKHIQNASRDEVRWVFNNSMCYLMPSVSEGLNLTPFESALCGCPAVICDGAIDEVFYHMDNCVVVPKNDKTEMYNAVKFCMDDFDILSPMFESNMRITASQFTWDNVVGNLMNILDNGKKG